MAESIVDFHIRSVMCAPLVNSEGDVMGVIQIDTVDQRNRFSRDDLDVLASVACQAAFAVENAQLHETAVRDQALKRELERRPRGAARLSALAPRRGSRATSSSISTSRPTNWAATITTTFPCPAGGWRWWWRTCRARAYRPRS